MNIAQALKLKNRIAKTLETKKGLLLTYNTYKEKNAATQEYNTKTLLSEINDEINNIVATKSAIAQANSEVYPKIFRMAELKGLISTLKTIPVKQGTDFEHVGGFVTRQVEEVVYKSTLTHTDIDNTVKSLEDEIEKIQGELDKFNFTTELKG